MYISFPYIFELLILPNILIIYKILIINHQLEGIIFPLFLPNITLYLQDTFSFLKFNILKILLETNSTSLAKYKPATHKS